MDNDFQKEVDDLAEKRNNNNSIIENKNIKNYHKWNFSDTIICIFLVILFGTRFGFIYIIFWILINRTVKIKQILTILFVIVLICHLLTYTLPFKKYLRNRFIIIPLVKDINLINQITNNSTGEDIVNAIINEDEYEQYKKNIRKTSPNTITISNQNQRRGVNLKFYKNGKCDLSKKTCSIVYSEWANNRLSICYKIYYDNLGKIKTE